MRGRKKHGKRRVRPIFGFVNTASAGMTAIWLWRRDHWEESQIVNFNLLEVRDIKREIGVAARQLSTIAEVTRRASAQA